ncbi:hypothetical protein EV649_7850 [Kribbella sp. VKM Ac-2569]|nr:hypothetical protein EV649_7850 [Kribbella sp. VKM Ac-2569]
MWVASNHPARQRPPAVLGMEATDLAPARSMRSTSHLQDFGSRLLHQNIRIVRSLDQVSRPGTREYVKQADKRRRADDLSGIDPLANRIETKPVDALRLVDVFRLTDVVGAVRHEQHTLGVRRTHRSPQGHQRLHVSRPPACLLLDLASRRHSRILIGVDVPAWKLLPPAVDDEAVPPHHQHVSCLSSSTTIMAALGVRSTYCSNRAPSGSSTNAMLNCKRRVCHQSPLAMDLPQCGFRIIVGRHATTSPPCVSPSRWAGFRFGRERPVAQVSQPGCVQVCACQCVRWQAADAASHGGDIGCRRELLDRVDYQAEVYPDSTYCSTSSLEDRQHVHPATEHA